MEISDPSGDPNDVWHVTNGRLVNVWREASGVRDRHGWATEAENGSPGAHQRSNYGTMILIGTPNVIWVFYGDLYWQMSGTWEVYPNTFNGWVHSRLSTRAPASVIRRSPFLFTDSAETLRERETAKDFERAL